MQILDGDILLCKGTGLVPDLIRWGTDSIYSHVAVIASAELGLVIEAIPCNSGDTILNGLLNGGE